MSLGTQPTAYLRAAALGSGVRARAYLVETIMSRPDAQPLFKGASAPKLQVRRKRLALRRRLATFKPKLARLGLVVPAGGYF